MRKKTQGGSETPETAARGPSGLEPASATIPLFGNGVCLGGGTGIKSNTSAGGAERSPGVALVKSRRRKPVAPCVQLERRGIRLMGAARFAEALAAFRQAVALDPECASHRFYHAQMLAEEDRTPEAVRELHQCVRLEPENMVFYGLLSRLYRISGWPEKALEAARRFASAFPENPVGRLDLAMALGENGMTEECEQGLLDLLKEDPDDTLLLNNLGCLYGESGRVDEARRLWLRCLDIDPEDEIAAKNLRISEDEGGDGNRDAEVLMVLFALLWVQSRIERFRRRWRGRSE